MIDRDKLGKVLALMASPFDGEALAATRKVVELLDKTGLRPEQLVDDIPKFDFGHLDGIARVLGGEADGGRQAGLCQEMSPCCICPPASPL